MMPELTQPEINRSIVIDVEQLTWPWPWHLVPHEEPTPEQKEKLDALMENLREMTKECKVVFCGEFDVHPSVAERLNNFHAEHEKSRKVAVIGGGVGCGLANMLLADKMLTEITPEVYHIGGTDNETWQPTKLRRGAGHNKYKKRGKK